MYIRMGETASKWSRDGGTREGACKQEPARVWADTQQLSRAKQTAATHFARHRPNVVSQDLERAIHRHAAPAALGELHGERENRIFSFKTLVETGVVGGGCGRDDYCNIAIYGSYCNISDAQGGIAILQYCQYCNIAIPGSTDAGNQRFGDDWWLMRPLREGGGLTYGVHGVFLLLLGVY